MTLPKSFTTVTTLSKILALILFVLFPFIGFYLGIQYQKILEINTSISTQTTDLNQIRPKLNICSQDSDCIVVDYKACCVSKQSINKKYKNIYNQHPELQELSSEETEICERIECDYDTRNYTAQCKNNRCTLSSINEVSNWKTYTSQEYGFEFMYPPDWFFKEYDFEEQYTYDNIIALGPSEPVSEEAMRTLDITAASLIEIRVDFLLSTKNLNPDAVVVNIGIDDSYPAQKTERYPSGSTPYYEKNKHIVEYRILDTYINIFYEGDLKTNTRTGDSIDNTEIEKTNYETFNQILSTFKFLDKENIKQ